MLRSVLGSRCRANNEHVLGMRRRREAQLAATALRERTKGLGMSCIDDALGAIYVYPTSTIPLFEGVRREDRRCDAWAKRSY